MIHSRSRLVREAYDRINEVNEENVSVDEIMERFTPDKHPDVLAGRKTTAQCKNELIAFFDVTGGGGTFAGSLVNADGTKISSSTSDRTITFGHFMDYWASISSTIDSDSDFETFLRACFR